MFRESEIKICEGENLFCEGKIFFREGVLSKRPEVLKQTSKLYAINSQGTDKTFRNASILITSTTGKLIVRRISKCLSSVTI